MKEKEVILITKVKGGYDVTITMDGYSFPFVFLTSALKFVKDYAEGRDTSIYTGTRVEVKEGTNEPELF